MTTNYVAVGVQEVGHWSSILPLAACLLFKVRSRDAWLLSAAFFVSFIADQIGANLQARGSPNWWVHYAYTPIQFGLMVAILAQSRAVRTVGVSAIGALAVVSWFGGTALTPETMVSVLGGLIVALLVLEHPRMARFRPALFAYCLAPIPFLLVIGRVEPSAHGLWFWAWCGLKATHVLSVVLMVVALRKPLLEVVDGPANLQDAGRRGRPIRVARPRAVRALEQPTARIKG